MSTLFQSQRLAFRNWSLNDLDEFAAMNADPEVMQHFPNTLSREESKAMIERLIAHFQNYGHTYYAVELIDSKELIGFIGLAYKDYVSDFTPAIDIGWRLKQTAWNNGYATEGAKRCIKHAFEELRIDRIISTCTANNNASEKVMQKIGMQKDGEFKHPLLLAYPDLVDCLCYEIRKD